MELQVQRLPLHGVGGAVGLILVWGTTILHGKKKLIRTNLQNPRDIFTPFLYPRIVWDFRGHFAQSLRFPGEEIVAVCGKSRIRFPARVMNMKSVLLAQRLPVLHAVTCPHPF